MVSVVLRKVTKVNDNTELLKLGLQYQMSVIVKISLIIRACAYMSLLYQYNYWIYVYVWVCNINISLEVCVFEPLN